MRRIPLILTLLILFLSEPASAYEIVVVKSSRNRVTEQIQQIFSREVERLVPRLGPSTIQPHRVREVLLDASGSDDIASKLRDSRPDLFLVIGSRALKAAVAVPDVPIVHLLASEIATPSVPERQVWGVRLSVAAEQQLQQVTHYFPGVKNIGIVYASEQSSATVERLRAAEPAIRVVAVAVDGSKDVPEVIGAMQGKIDLLWMLPDLTVTNHKTLESYLLFSINNNIPLLTFSEKILKQGATIAVGFDLEGIARQAAGLGVRLLGGSNEQERRLLVDPQVKTTINRKVMEKLGLALPAEGEGRD